MRLPKGSEMLCEKMGQFDDLNRSTVGYRPHPPVTNDQIRWIDRNLPALEELCRRPLVGDQDNRVMLGLMLSKFMVIYLTTSNEKRMGESDYKTDAMRREVIAEGLLDDLGVYPLWAVAEGLAEYRKSTEGKWAPKVSGELIPYISGAYSRAYRTRSAAERLRRSNEMGHNLDSMKERLEAETDPKEKAYVALDVMNVLRGITDLARDDGAKALHDRCYGIFHSWRRKNPLPPIIAGGSDDT